MALKIEDLNDYINTHIDDFQNNRIACLRKIRLKDLVDKNPYLLRARNVLVVAEFVDQTLQAYLSSSEEKLFGDFLEGLAIFVAERTSGGHKSTSQGIDLEFIRENRHYFISVKSGSNWGNASQHHQLERDLQNAVTRLRQAQSNLAPEPVLGICYGKTRISYLHGYTKVVGQNFWYLISQSRELYKEIIEPVGYRAREHNDEFLQERAGIFNLLTGDFCARFCDAQSGRIDWPRLVEANSGNFASILQ